MVSSVRNSPLGLGMLPVVPAALGLVSRQVFCKTGVQKVILFQHGEA